MPTHQSGHPICSDKSQNGVRVEADCVGKGKGHDQKKVSKPEIGLSAAIEALHPGIQPVEPLNHLFPHLLAGSIYLLPFLFFLQEDETLRCVPQHFQHEEEEEAD